MNTKRFIWICGVMLLVLMALVSCRKPEESVKVPFLGHWGCEQYISCRTDSIGNAQWDTLRYEVGAGHGYEVWFDESGKGKLTLNDSPAFIKTFTCDYQYDADRKVITIQGQALLYALYGSLYLDQNCAEFNIEQVTDTTLQASWHNVISEPMPFDEWFYLKKID